MLMIFGKPTSHEAEAMTLLSTISWVESGGYQNITFETNCKHIVDDLQARNFVNSESG